MLVYENYSKFIAATDTIRLMSASMEGLDERMAHLRTLIGGLSGREGGWGAEDGDGGSTPVLPHR